MACAGDECGIYTWRARMTEGASMALGPGQRQRRVAAPHRCHFSGTAAAPESENGAEASFEARGELIHDEGEAGSTGVRCDNGFQICFCLEESRGRRNKTYGEREEKKRSDHAH